MKRTLAISILLCAMLIPISADGISSPSISGTTGYLVLPSAEVNYSKSSPSVASGYGAVVSSSGMAHLPYLQMAFKDAFELALAFDIQDKTNLLLNGKWRFSHSGDSSMATGLVAQAIQTSSSWEYAAQLYVASTFDSTIMDFPSKTTLMLGYTFHKELNTNIDFGLAFQTPFFPDIFKNNVDFLLDFGNASYSIDPSGGNAEQRGMVNIGLRLIPVEFIDSVYFGADLRALDLFDHQGRAINLSVSITFRP